MKIMYYSLENIQEIIDIIVKKTIHTRFFLLDGQLGSGKTTLVRCILESLGIKGIITSPTFTYINIYYSPILNKNIYHFDLYRLTSLDEFYALGLDEFLEDQNALFFIEWPGLILPAIKKNNELCEISIKYVQDSNQRNIIINDK
jgi:tRNA threonylcarbamoyladenosine biosynthesis protein TsaE